ncbi:hypothetical protein M433DRAFT_152584 [Acidomyces richmondensis BFW]|nr:hypothetical protein M433DRAFT_152584 [Acidomyces richmondensis BFW]
MANNVEYESSLQGLEPTSPADRRSGEQEGPVTQKRQHSRAATTYPRKRATRACLTCRFRRTKCDNARPSCASCVRLGADCTYQPTDSSSFDSASLAILKRLDDLEALILTKNADHLQFGPPVAKGHSTSPATQSDLGSTVDGFQALGKRSLISVEAVLQWQPLAEFKFSPYHSFGRYTEHEATPPALVDIDLPAAENVLRNFFDHVHIFNPILEEEDVRDYVRKVRFTGIGWDAMSCLVVSRTNLLIYAHGSIATPFFHSTPDIAPAVFRLSPAYLQAESYFLAAQKRMGMLLCGNSVIDAQCFFLAGVYLMATLRPVEAWKLFVQALACCQGFSVNRYTYGGCPENEWNLKQRIYWTCFKSELELRLELNLLQKDAWDLAYPSFYPSPPEALKTKDEAAWYFYLAEIALRRMKNRILSHLYRYDPSLPSESGMENVVLDFEEQIDAWLRSLPEPLAFGVSDKEQNEPLQFILACHFIDCQEILYWPFVTDAAHGRFHGSSTDILLRKGLKVCVDRIEQNRKGFYHRHHGTWLMLRSCTRSALVLLAATRCPELQQYLPVAWEESVLHVTRMLRFWKDEARDIGEMLNIVETLLGSRPN